MKALPQNTLIQNRYLIVHLIGKGGMGEVYLAVDQRLGSAVALKRTFFAGDELLGNAFEREARTLARMRHPVLPKVSDHFGENDEQFLVMEHISGDDLGKRLEIAQKPFPISWVLFWADQLLDALSYLHMHEPPIIHRDIKPQNLKLTDENHIILLDFGLSKTSTGQTHLSDHGSTGSVIGYTPHYASMEQIRGIGTSGRSDLYSLSATLYQLMTNTVPADALSRADSLLNEMPDPIKPIFELNPEIPVGISNVILKGMEVSQEKRHSNAREMQKGLRKAFTDMQRATTAETVAFNLSDGKMAAIDQPAAAFAQSDLSVKNQVNQPSRSNSLRSESHATGDFSGNNRTGGPDFDTTIALNSEVETVSIRQADVKTEVFSASDNSFPGRDQQTPVTTDRSKNDVESVTADKVLETVPYIPLRGDSPNELSNGGGDTSEFNSNSATHPNAFSTVVPPYFEPPQATAEARSEALPLPGRRPVASVSEKKTPGHNFALLSGFAALLILGALGAVGGWYYYANYYPSESIAGPTPSPEMIIRVSPTQAPILDSKTLEDQGLGNISDPDSNLNVADREGLTVAPTPATGPITRPQGAARTPPARTSATPGIKATPKPKATVDRTKILQ